MVSSFVSLYHSIDLNGECLVQPLKTYHNRFVYKIENSSGLQKIAWRIVHIVSGIVTYPIYGALAGLGLFIKLPGIYHIKKHNESEKLIIQGIYTGIKHTKGYSKTYTSSSAFQTIEIQKFTITKQNLDNVVKEINERIDYFSEHFRKVHLYCDGTIDKGKGEIIVKLKLNTYS